MRVVRNIAVIKMGMFDYFVAELICPDCAFASPADSCTNMQTKIQRDMRLNMLSVGSKLDIDYPVINSGYVEIRRPKIDSTFTIIDSWECPKCNDYKWAMIDIIDSKIVKIHAIIISKSIIESVNYISNDITDWGWKIENGNASYTA